MEDIAERIRELMQSQQLSNTEFAKRIAVSPPIISHIMSGRNNPSLQLIQNIKSAFPNVNTDYLLFGEGGLFQLVTNVNEANVYKSKPEREPVPSSPVQEEVAQESPTPATADEQSEDRLKSPSGDLQMENVRQKATSAPEKEIRAPEGEIERIVIFYKDGKFKAYNP